MTIARAQLVDTAVTRWYHCVSRCVRRAFLLSEDAHNRKEWIENRLEVLSECFAVAVGGFSVMDNHLHVLLRLDPSAASDWSDEEVVLRWGRLCPPRDKFDEEALLSTSVYIDLNPVAAKIAETPETSDYTSIKQRVAHVEAQDQTAQLVAARDGSVAGSHAAASLEESLWLCPIEDRRRLDSAREGMVEGFSLGSYLCLVDYTGRLFRQGKATISAELAGIFERLGCDMQSWQVRMEKLREGRLLGRFFAASRAKLREIAERLGVRRLANLAACPAR